MEDWLITLISTASSVAVSTIVGFIIKNGITKKVSEHDELVRLRSEKEREEYKKEISTVLKEELIPLNAKIDNLSSISEINRLGNVTLMRETMKQTRDQFVKQGYATTSDSASWQELYNAYKEAGGNHFIEYVDAWKQDVEALPREKVKKISKNK